MNKTCSCLQLFLIVSLTLLSTLYLAPAASAYPTGISGHSGNPATNGGAICTACHSTGGSRPTVSISGPTNVASGSTSTYTLNNNGVPNSGLDVSATQGTLTVLAGTGTQVLNSEITHTQALTTAPLSWKFSWRAPTVNTSTTVTMYAASISGGTGGSTGTTSLAITVSPSTSAPTITTQPASQTVAVGQTATFSVTATGSALSYQWKKNTVNISGATASSYTTPATTTADNNSVFSVVVSNSAGSVTSANATLTVSTSVPVAVSITPGSPTLVADGTQQFTAAVTGTTNTAVTWSANGGTISSSGLYTAPSTAGTYTVTATSQADTTKSASATVTVTSSIASGSYTLLAWSELGMHCVDGKDYSVLSILPPYNTIYAKLIKTGTPPAEVTSGVNITYQAADQQTYVKTAVSSINTTSAGTNTIPQKSNFWSWVYTLLKASLQPDVGARGFAMQNLNPQSMVYGSFVLDQNLKTWKAEGIPITPYDDKLAVNPYPMAKIVATDSSGKVLATTTVVLAVSDDLSCKNCHASNTNKNAMPSGGWITGYTDDQNWRLNVLKKHDDRNMTSSNWSNVIAAVNAKGYSYKQSLYDTASALNNPVFCDACHRSNAVDAALDGLGLPKTGVAGVNPLTQDMHTLHSGVTLPGSHTTLDKMNSASNPGCYQCHPGPTTQCQRGAMTGTIPGSTAITCYGCHGNLSNVGSSSRQGWLDVPNCQMCHQNGTTYTSALTKQGAYRTSTDTTFATTPNSPPAPVLGNAGPYSLYRYSTGHSNIECAACHGSQHAEYPTSQNNDNVYSIKLQQYAGRITECTVCHGSTPPTTNNGGPHGMHTVGSAWVSAHPTYAGGGGYTACAYCHGSDYKGTPLSMILTSKTLAGKTFPAYHQMNCYDCHNGPTGG